MDDVNVYPLTISEVKSGFISGDERVLPSEDKFWQAANRREVEFDSRLRSVQEVAWDEGHTHCFHVENPNNPIKGNPYRKDE